MLLSTFLVVLVDSLRFSICSYNFGGSYMCSDIFTFVVIALHVLSYKSQERYIYMWLIIAHMVITAFVVIVASMTTTHIQRSSVA